METKYSETYLYKLHKLTNSMDKIFDRTLKNFGDIGLSQLSLLMSVASLQPTSQHRIGTFLDQTPGAISRQVELARHKGWLKVGVDKTDRRNRQLSVTRGGIAAVDGGVDILNKHLFKIFTESEQSSDLMGHIDRLLEKVEEVSAENIIK